MSNQDESWLGREVDEIIMRFLGQDVWEQQVLIFSEQKLPSPPKVPVFCRETVRPGKVRS